MIYNLYSIYDDVSEEFGTPFLANNNAIAIRTFKNYCTAIQEKFLTEDLNLYHIGTFNNKNALSENIDKERIFKGKDIEKNEI